MRVEVEGKKREKTKLTLPFLFLPFNLSSSSFSSSSSSSNTMLGSAPQLQDAPGVAYLCGDCGECEKNREVLTGDRRFFFFFFPPSPSSPSTDALSSFVPCGRPGSSSLSVSIVPRCPKRCSLTRAS